ncbi:MAG: ion transporter [Ignavibacteriaceae bacterium]
MYAIPKNILYRRTWQLIITICSIFLAIYIPLNIVMKISPGIYLSIFYWLITVVFTIDILVNYLFPHTDVSQHSNIKEKREQYLKTWFIIDLLAAIPFLFVFPVLAIGVFRLLKLIRVAQYMHHTRQRAIRYGDFLILGFFIFWLLLFAHWLACGWIYLRDFPADADNLTKYVTSLYWVIETLTTVGYGETTPLTNAQHIYAMIIMLAGVGVYGFIIGNVANLLSKRNPARNQFFNNLDQLKVFVNYRNIPLSLQKKISDYYTYIWKKKLGFDESVFLSGLPQGLQNEVSIHLKRDILEKIPLFKGVSDNFLRDVSLHMRPIVCVPGECVFNEGDIGNEMYFVIRGKLEVVMNDEHLSVLTDGDFFGEISLFTEQKRRTAAVRSQSYSDLYRLDRELFDEVLRRYPKIAEHIKKIADERIGQDKGLFKKDN